MAIVEPEDIMVKRRKPDCRGDIGITPWRTINEPWIVHRDQTCLDCRAWWIDEAGRPG